MDVKESSYQIRGTMLKIRLGNLAKTAADVLVSSDDSRLSMTGGISKALLDGGGPPIRLDAQKHVPRSIRDVVVTTAGTLPAQYIFHTVTIDYVKLQFASEPDIRFMTTRCLEMADALEAKSIAFPTLGTGTAGFPIAEAVKILLETIGEYLEADTHLSEVTLVLYEKEYIPGVGPEGIQQVYNTAVGLASAISQRQRVSTLLTELDGLLTVSGLPAGLAAIREKVEAVESTMASLRRHVADLVLDSPKASMSGKGTDAAPQPLPSVEGVEYETLRKVLSNRLEVGDIQSIAYDLLGPDHNVLQAGTKQEQLLSLFANLYNRQMIGELLKWIRRNRPDIQF